MSGGQVTQEVYDFAQFPVLGLLVRPPGFCQLWRDLPFLVVNAKLASRAFLATCKIFGMRTPIMSSHL